MSTFQTIVAACLVLVAFLLGYKARGVFLPQKGEAVKFPNYILIPRVEEDYGTSFVVRDFACNNCGEQLRMNERTLTVFCPACGASEKIESKEQKPSIGKERFWQAAM